MVGPLLFFGGYWVFRKLSINENQKFLLVFSIPIFIIVFIEAVFVRANANWAAPALISFFVLLYIFLNRVCSSFKSNVKYYILFYFLCSNRLSYPAKFFDRISGLGEFSNKVYSQGSKKNISNFVVSDRLLFSSMNYQLKEKGVGVLYAF